MGEYFSILAGLQSCGVGGVSVVQVLSPSDESTVMSKIFDLTGAARLGVVGWLEGEFLLDDRLRAECLGEEAIK